MLLGAEGLITALPLVLLAPYLCVCQVLLAKAASHLCKEMLPQEIQFFPFTVTVQPLQSHGAHTRSFLKAAAAGFCYK